MSQNKLQKPPKGVIPNFVFERLRMEELSKSIHEHISGGYIGGGYKDTLLEWLKELTQKLENYKRNR